MVNSNKTGQNKGVEGTFHLMKHLNQRRINSSITYKEKNYEMTLKIECRQTIQHSIGTESVPISHQRDQVAKMQRVLIVNVFNANQLIYTSLQLQLYNRVKEQLVCKSMEDRFTLIALHHTLFQQLRNYLLTYKLEI